MLVSFGDVPTYIVTSAKPVKGALAIDPGSFGSFIVHSVRFHLVHRAWAVLLFSDWALKIHGAIAIASNIYILHQ